MKNIFAFIIISLLVLSGCGTIYSPTLNLPHEPLAKNEGQITGTLGLAYCGEGQIAYAFQR